MNTITLLYRATTKPVLTDRNGEAIGNWTSGGTHTLTVDAAYPHTGTKSYKLVATNIGDITTNFAKLPSASFADMTVGTQYVITLWMRSASGSQTWVLQCDGTSTTITTTATYAPFQLVFTAAHTTADFFVLNGVASAQTGYYDDITVTQGVVLNVLSVRGMDDPDSIEMFPPIQNRYLDGSIDEQFQKFRRKMIAQTHVVSAKSDRIGVLYWHLDTSRMVNYLTEAQIPAALQAPEGYESTWFDNFVLARAFTLSFQATTVTDTWPVP